MMSQPIVETEIGKIEETLNRLWLAQPRTQQVRACLFNLIIYSNDQRRAAYLHQIVQDILQKFPCRIIFIQVIKDAKEEYLRTSVGQVTLGKGDAAVVCDEINIDVTENQLYRVPFVLYPILVPDLPVYLVWGQNPMTENTILPGLQPYASRLIFDSECADNLPDFSQKIIQMLDATKLEIRDVKWASIGGWRDIFTQVFANKKEIDHLQNCREIQMTFNGRKSIFVSHTEIPILYLQFWLAARFNWKFKSLETATDFRQLTYETENNTEVKVTVIAEDIPEISAGTITSIQILTSDPDETTYSLIRQAHQPRVALHIANKEKCDMPHYYLLNELTNSTAFMTEIFYRKTSDHYRKMLSVIANINKV